MNMNLENEPSWIPIPQAQKISTSRAPGRNKVVVPTDRQWKTFDNLDVLGAVPIHIRDVGDYGEEELMAALWKSIKEVTDGETIPFEDVIAE